MPPQNWGKPQFLEIFPVFFKQVYNFFWLMLLVIPVCHFEGLSIVEKNEIEKK